MSVSTQPIGKLDRSMKIYQILEQLDLPQNGQLILPVKIWKRKNWVTKKYVFEYDYEYDSFTVGLHLFELECTYDESNIEHHIDTYETHQIW